MSWSKFFITIFVIYFIYYAVNIVLDLMNGGKKTNNEVLETLSFSDDYKPKKVQFEEEEVLTEKKNLQSERLENEKISVEETKIEQVEILERKEVNSKKTETGISGGLTISELINLAKTEAIVKSKSIAFA